MRRKQNLNKIKLVVNIRIFKIISSQEIDREEKSNPYRYEYGYADLIAHAFTVVPEYIEDEPGDFKEAMKSRNK